MAHSPALGLGLRASLLMLHARQSGCGNDD
jgi:hypothetical protein